MDHPFQLRRYRPIYLWEGSGAIRMNRVKLMDYPVDEEAHPISGQKSLWL